MGKDTEREEHKDKERKKRRESEGAEVLERLKHTEFDGAVDVSSQTLSGREARRVMDFALRLGQELFLCGFDTQTIESSVIAVSTALGLNHLEVDITARTIHLQYAPPHEIPASIMRVTRTAEDPRDLRRMAALHRLVGHVVAERLDVRQSLKALRRIQDTPPHWPWWVRTVGGGVLAASVTLQVGGSAWAALTAVAVLMACDRVGWLLLRGAMPFFFAIAVQAALAVALGIALSSTSLIGPYSTAVMAANLVVLLPIVPLIALPQDGITGFSLMAATRAVNVTLALAGMATGVLVVALLADEATEDIYAPQIDHATLPVWGGLIVSAVGALGNCFSMGGNRRLLPVAVAAGVMGGAVNMAVSHAVHAPALAVLCAAAALGASAAVCSPALRVPAAAVVIPGTTGALLPSLQVYESLTQLSVGREGAGTAALLALLSTATIGVGAVAGSLIGHGLIRVATRLRLVPQPD
ncbi:threonine/serine exporter ThrE family protein [Streptomyces sp. NPDC087300]|uniref:threonine/serine ThrE exporter family protein n=1 Tax=Streptomyces sp. NPDC087300 TaxID=3365780 RepID=UPI00381856EE